MRINRIKKYALPIALLLLLLSMLINLALYSNLRKYYIHLYAQELDPLGLSYFQNDTPQSKDNFPVVVFFGDSRALQWTTPLMEGFSFVNRGIGNQTSSQVANRFDAHVKPLKPSIVIVQVCINDLKTIPLFPGRRQEIIENCEKNIQKIIQDSLKIEATVIITTVFPPNEKVPIARQLVWSDDVYKAVDEVNIYIQGLEKDKVLVFDAASILSNSEGKILPKYSYDLLHLNDTGYQALNRELIKEIEQIK